jgi:hypothetical protein
LKKPPQRRLQAAFDLLLVLDFSGAVPQYLSKAPRRCR